MNRDFKLLLTSLFYPNKCLICGKITKYNNLICHICKDDGTIHLPEDYYETQETVEVYAPFVYNEAARFALLKFKYGQNVDKCYKFSLAMSDLLIKYNIHKEIDIITYVPKYYKDKHEFNSAYELAKIVSRILKIPISNKILVKIRKTQKQHNLGKEFREINLLNAFECHAIHQVQNKTILLIDDVHTTGNTLNICSKTLLQYGATKIICSTATINL